jgi:hypothetical protein
MKYGKHDQQGKVAFNERNHTRPRNDDQLPGSHKYRSANSNTFGYRTGCLLSIILVLQLAVGEKHKSVFFSFSITFSETLIIPLFLK